MFRDSQKLYALRQEEANLIAEICGAQVSIMEKLKRLTIKKIPLKFCRTHEV